MVQSPVQTEKSCETKSSNQEMAAMMLMSLQCYFCNVCLGKHPCTGYAFWFHPVILTN